MSEPHVSEPVERALAEMVFRALPGAKIERVTALAADSGADGKTTKGAGYGQPLKIDVSLRGERRRLVLHTATPNDFGHDRRADRAGEMLLAYDTFEQIPAHVQALSVGAFDRRGGLISLDDAGEFYLLTTWAEGDVYAEQLRRIGRDGRSTERDAKVVESLARYLADLHSVKIDRPAGYVRCVRDLVGSGEGIYGIVDGYPERAPGVPEGRVRDLERKCAEWRWRLRGREKRLSRIHADFHPFNIVLGKNDELGLLDTSRGSVGEPADDLTALAVNFLFFALEAPGSWQDGFRPLWRRFFEVYLESSGDRDLLDVAPPFFAWRGLVVANPAWYPDVEGVMRTRLLGFVERTLDAAVLDVDSADVVFR